jgi:hypothetical protein
MESSVSASGARSVAIGGDVIASLIVTGDNNQIFVGAFELLRDVYIAPLSVFTRVNLDQFVGRAWLDEGIDRFLAHNDKGYIILEAAAGLGKTTFMAHLVKERGWIHFFAEQAPGQEGIGAAVRSLAAQLIRAWEIQPYSGSDVLPGSLVRPDFLEKTLFQAAQRRDELRPGEPIVLVVDALNEAGTPPGQNVLGLPRDLPHGVFVIASQQPVAVTLTSDAPKHVLRLLAGSEQNHNDMREFLEKAVTLPNFTSLLQKVGKTSDEIINILLTKSAGVWIYLHYVLAEIEQGDRDSLALDDLPDGLLAYYVRYWRRQRDAHESHWDTDLRPLLATLGATQEPIPVELLRVWSGATLDASPVGRILSERWRPFVSVEQGEEVRFHLYHSSLHDFLEGRGDLEGLSEADRALIGELADATRRAHSRIANYFLATWGGLDSGLQTLMNASSSRVAHNSAEAVYGLRYLSAHLEGAGRDGDLHQLLRLEQAVAEANPEFEPGPTRWFHQITGRIRTPQDARYKLVWYWICNQMGMDTVFVRDVAMAWALAQAAGETHLRGTEREDAPAVGLQCYYAVVDAWTTNMARSVPARLMADLVAHHIWTIAKAREYARREAFADYRAICLAGLAPLAPEDQQRTLIHEAVDAARLALQMATQGEGVWWAGALASVIPYMSEPERINVLTEAVAFISTTGDSDVQAAALLDLAPYWPEALIEQVRARTSTTPKKSMEAELETLAELVLREHVPQAEWPLVKYEVSQNKHVAGVAVASSGVAEETTLFLSEEEGRLLLDEAIRVARRDKAHFENGYSADREEALIDSLAALPKELIGEAIQFARAFYGDSRRLFASLALRASEPERSRILSKVLTPLRGGVSDRLEECARHRYIPMVVTVAPHLPEALLSRAMQFARSLPNNAMALRALASRLPEPNRRATLLEALANCMPSLKYSRVEARKALIPYLPQRLLAEAARYSHTAPGLLDWWGDDPSMFVRRAPDRRERAELLLTLVLRLPEGERAPVFREIMRLMRSEDFGRDRILITLVPHLPTTLMGEALKLWRGISHSNHTKYAVLEVLAPRLPKVLLAEAIHEAFKDTRSSHERGTALMAVAPYLTDADIPTALTLTRALPETYSDDRIRICGMLSARLPEPERVALLAEALKEVRNIRENQVWTDLLQDLIPYLPSALIPEAIDVAHHFARIRPIPFGGEAEHSATPATLIALARHLSEPDREAMLVEALELVIGALERDMEAERAGDEELSMSQREPYLTAMLLALAHQLPESMLEQVLELAEVNRARIDFVAVVAALVPRLPEALVNQVYQFSREFSAGEVLTAFAPILPEAERALVLLDALRAAIADPNHLEWSRLLEILAGLGPDIVSDTERVSILAAALNKAVAVDSDSWRALLLEVLTPHLLRLPYSALYSIWCGALHVLGSRTCEDLIAAMAFLAPVIHALGQEESVACLWDTMARVDHWLA